ncbi:MAG: protein kinase [Polyangiaceae bacterium]
MPDPAELPAGAVIDGRYRVVRLIGAGGTGAVYEVEHLHTGQRLALKSLLDPSHTARLEQEARALARLRSPHVVKVVDYGTAPSGPFMVMNLLVGRNLRDVLEARAPMSLEFLANMTLQVCEGLDEAHRAGLVHRDLKPDNLHLSDPTAPDDPRAPHSPHPLTVVTVFDFGVVKLAGAVLDNPLTRTGSTVGTPYYMSLEQLRGSGTVDAVSDVYGLAVVLYECLAGERPFEAGTLGDLIFAICSMDPKDLRIKRPDLPPAIIELLMNALSRDKAKRPQSMREIAEVFAPLGDAAYSKWMRLGGSLGTVNKPAAALGASAPVPPAATPAAPPVAQSAGPRQTALGVGPVAQKPDNAVTPASAERAEPPASVAPPTLDKGGSGSPIRPTTGLRIPRVGGPSPSTPPPRPIVAKDEPPRRKLDDLRKTAKPGEASNNAPTPAVGSAAVAPDSAKPAGVAIPSVPRVGARAGKAPVAPPRAPSLGVKPSAPAPHPTNNEESTRLVPVPTPKPTPAVPVPPVKEVDPAGWSTSSDTPTDEPSALPMPSDAGAPAAPIGPAPHRPSFATDRDTPTEMFAPKHENLVPEGMSPLVPMARPSSPEAAQLAALMAALPADGTSPMPTMSLPADLLAPPKLSTGSLSREDKTAILDIAALQAHPPNPLPQLGADASSPVSGPPSSGSGGPGALTPPSQPSHSGVRQVPPPTPSNPGQPTQAPYSQNPWQPASSPSPTSAGAAHNGWSGGYAQPAMAGAQVGAVGPQPPMLPGPMPYPDVRVPMQTAPAGLPAQAMSSPGPQQVFADLSFKARAKFRGLSSEQQLVVVVVVAAASAMTFVLLVYLVLF